MFVCLSSGLSRRYKKDIPRALAQPRGSVLQFRYLEKYLASGVLAKAQTAKQKPLQALIAYIDLSDPNKAPEIVPCRFATVRDKPTPVGTALAVQLELQEFAVASDLAAFNRELKEKSLGNLPVWQDEGGKKKAKGHYWLQLSSDLSTAVRSEKLGEWEKIVDQLAQRSDFKEEGSFYTVMGINEIPSGSAVSANTGRYEFEPGHEYELSLYHFYPIDVPLNVRLTLATTSEWLKFTTNPVLQLDSRYDLKRVRFKTAKPSSREDAWLSVMRNNGDNQPPNVEFDLLGRIRSVFWQRLAYGVLLGIFVGGPSIVAALSNPSLPADNVTLVCLTSALLGVAAGITAAFGLKKSP